VRRAVFLGRDGVISVIQPTYVKYREELHLLPHSIEGLRILARLPLKLFVVTNQSVINRGLAPEKVVIDINDRLCAIVRAAGGRIDDVFCCPHMPMEHCSCRKPQPGLLLAAADRHDVDLSHSYLVGDSVTDLEAALVVGVRPILVLTGGGETEYHRLRDQRYGHVPVMTDLLAAARLIEGLELDREVLEQAGRE
jgi:D-glycero-D-manno-heptose 1,7-bisphosphate phosphatase